MKTKEIWYKQLGFHNNPFSIKPAAFYDELLGYDHVVKKVNNSIETNKLIYVEGEYGNGKSSLLRRILHRFGGKGKIIYFSCNRIEKTLNINKLLNERYGTIGKVLNLKPKNMILLLDEAQWLPKEDYSRVLRYFRGGYFRSIVFVGKEYDESVFIDGFKSSLVHIKLGEISEDDAVSVIRKRVGNLPTLSNDIIKMIFNKADKNVRKLLKYSEIICKTAIEREEDFVTPEIINEVFEDELNDEIENLKKEVEEIQEFPEDDEVEEIKAKVKKATKEVEEEKSYEDIEEVEDILEAKELDEEKPKEELDEDFEIAGKEEFEEEKSNEEFEEVEDILEASPAEEIEEIIKKRNPSKSEPKSGKVEELYY
ncbi:MAG: hypothetical protein KJ939_02265 [Nanoarchaeota archaeon]|nr:hypothetical protein [Nanoarchaeota archaeon]MBU4351883.1 hypothetical protein [Nanoarchaeota archaeon]